MIQVIVYVSRRDRSALHFALVYADLFINVVKLLDGAKTWNAVAKRRAYSFQQGDDELNAGECSVYFDAASQRIGHGGDGVVKIFVAVAGYFIYVILRDPEFDTADGNGAYSDACGSVAGYVS